MVPAVTRIGPEDIFMPPLTDTRAREAGIELCRIFCGLCIIAVHTSHIHPASPAVSFVWTMAKCAATPVFFLITGYFFSPVKPFREHLSRLAARVVIPVIVTMLLIAQLSPWLAGQMSLNDCMEALHWDNFTRVARIWLNFWPYEYLPEYNPFGPLWFTFAFIQCYLFFPLLTVLCGEGAGADRLRWYFFLLGLLVFVGNVSLKTSLPDNAVLNQLDWGIPQKPFYWLWLILLGYQTRLFVRNHEETIQGLRPAFIASGLAFSWPEASSCSGCRSPSMWMRPATWTSGFSPGNSWCT